MSSLTTTRNHILAGLPAESRAALGALEHVHLEKHERLETIGERTAHLYFPEDCLISIIADNGDGGRIEVGMIGYEGLSGAGLAEGDAQCVFESLVLGSGWAYRATADGARQAMGENDALRQSLLLYARAFAIQVAWTAFANGHARLESRLARWLLMVADRKGNSFDITHEFLGTMLAVRRAGVTTALQELEGKGLIRTRRGAITLMDREGLMEHASGSYGAPEREYRRLMGTLAH